MGLFDAIAEIVEEVVETAGTAAEAAVTTAQAIVDDATAAARDAGEATEKAAEAAARALAVNLNAAARGAGHVPQQGQELLKETGDRLEGVLSDPLGTAARGLAGVAKGVGQFGENVGNQLKQGVGGWLANNFEDAGIPLPDTYDLRHLLDFVLDVTGATYDRLRERSGRLFGDSTNAAEPGGGATPNPPRRWRLMKGTAGGEVNGLSAQVANRIHFLLDRQSIPRVHRLSSADKSQGDKTPVVVSLGRRFVRDLFADHLILLAARSRSLAPSLPRPPRPVAPHEPILASGLELALKILALNARARDMVLSSGNIMKRIKVRR